MKKFSELRIANHDPKFKGWQKPGPFSDLEAAKDLVLEDDETLDGFCGHFRIAQLKDGHRFSTDDVLCGWYAAAYAPSPRQVLDLGSGIGTVAICFSWCVPGAQISTIEAQERSVSLCRKSVAFNGLTDRFSIFEGDFRDFEFDEKFDLVMGSPPYFPASDGPVSEHPQKAACRFELRGAIDAYAETARRAMAPGGWFVSVFPIDPPHQKARVEEAAKNAGLHIVRWRPVALQEHGTHNLGLFAMMRQEDAPQMTTWEEPTLVVRQTDGTLSDEYLALKMSFGFPPTQ